MTPFVRLAGTGDADAVTRLLAAFRDWWGKDVPTDERMGETVAALLGDPNTEFLLGAAAAGEPHTGLCQLRYRLSAWTGTDDCWLEDLYVRDDARGTGVGRALVEAAVERARERGCRRIELDVNEQNTGALAFYERLGFATEPKPPGRTLFISRRI